MVLVCLPSDALSQHLPSYLGFSYLGHRVSFHSCSSKAQLLLLTLDKGCLLMVAPLNLERGVAPLGPPAPPAPSSHSLEGADCGSGHELLIAKFRLKLKKVGITTRPFRCDLNQIPYDYTVGVKNRFKGLDLIESLMNYGWRFVTLYRRQGSRPSSWKRNAKRQNGCLRRP